MKKQEMHPDKDQNRNSEKGHAQDKSSKAKTQQPEERSDRKTSGTDEDMDVESSEKRGSKKEAPGQRTGDVGKTK